MPLVISPKDITIYGPGQTPEGPDLTETEIESDAVRGLLKLDEANLCISIQPGEELGQVYVLVQYEGPKGQANLCMDGQNDLLMAASKWLKDLFADTLGEWRVKIDAQPCPKATKPYLIFEAVQELGDIRDISEDQERRQDRRTDPRRHDRDIGHGPADDRP